MHRIKIYTIGKIKESWLQEGIEEYVKRLKPSLTLDWILAKNLPVLEQLLESEPHFTSLDPQGKLFSSEQFSEWLQQTLYEGGSRLTLLIGGAEGFTDEIRNKANMMLSFGQQTWPHVMVRVMLLEQIYRAQQIIAGHPYHREG